MKSKHLIFGLLFCLSLYSCLQYEQKHKEVVTEKEIELPKGSFWVSSVDKGGIWIHVESVHSHKNNALISIFDGDTKEFLERKRFTLICSSDPSDFIWIENLEEQIKVYDKGIFRFESKNCWLQ